MPTSSPHTMMLMGVSLAAPAAGAKLLRSIVSIDFLSGAAELFADAIDLRASGHLADRFHAEHLTFQMAKSEGRDGEAVRLAHTELASMISGIPRGNWPGVAREVSEMGKRTGVHAPPWDAVIHAREILGAGHHSWRPEIVVHGKDPKHRAAGRAAVRRVFSLLLPLAINADNTYPEWCTRTFNSGMLTAPRVEFSFLSLAEAMLPADVVLGVKRLGVRNGVPHFQIAYDDEDRLDEAYLAYALLRASVSSERRCNIRQKDFDAASGQKKAPPRSKARFLDTMMKGSSLKPSYMNAAMPVQAALLRGEGNDEIDDALKEIGVLNQSRLALIDRLKALRLRFTIREEPAGKANAAARAYILRKLPREDVMKRDFRRDFALKIDFRLSPEVTEDLSAEDVWMFLARAYAIWMSHDRPDKLQDVDLSSHAESLYGVTFDGQADYISVSPRIDRDWAQKFSRLVGWAGNFDPSMIEVSRERFPGLAELLPHLLADASTGVGEVTGSFHVNVIDSKERSENGIVTMELRDDRHRTVHAKVSLDFGEVPDVITPLGLMELLLRARAGLMIDAVGLRKMSREGLHLSQMANIRAFDARWNDAWTWLRLILDYEELLSSEKTESGLDIAGGGAREVADKLVPALRAVQVANGSLFARSVSAHDNWMVETSAVIHNYESDKYKRRVPASKMTVLTAKRAKLIHFNGEPLFDARDWERMVEIILAAPEGITWVRPKLRWDSNRPALVLKEGEKKWYAMNPVYGKASQRERTKYRRALGFVRTMAWRYAKQIGLPPPEPRTSREDMQALRSRMMGLFHTDTAARSDHIAISDDDLRELIKSFKTLLKFH